MKVKIDYTGPGKLLYNVHNDDPDAMPFDEAKRALKEYRDWLGAQQQAERLARLIACDCR